MKIEIYNRQKKLPISKPTVKKIVEAVLDFEGQSCDEISIHFVTLDEITSLHDIYFNDPTPTDCITFPIDDPEDESGYKVLGEVFVCPETAILYTKKHGGQPLRECILYIVHGLLHLLGLTDLQPRLKLAMRRAEKRNMDHLESLNLLP